MLFGLTYVIKSRREPKETNVLLLDHRSHFICKNIDNSNNDQVEHIELDSIK